jgi:quinol monooxygenase YgiN
MTEIRADTKILTFINVFSVKPQDSDALLQLLIEATNKVMCKLPGFVSANFHQSSDGSKIINYAQWENRDAFDAMLRTPVAIEHMLKIREIATSEKDFYKVVSVHETSKQ